MPHPLIWLSTLLLFGGCLPASEDSKSLTVFPEHEGSLKTQSPYLIRLTDGQGCWGLGVILRSQKPEEHFILANLKQDTCALPSTCDQLRLFSERGEVPCEKVNQKGDQLLLKHEFHWIGNCAFFGPPQRMQRRGFVLNKSQPKKKEEIREMRSASFKEDHIQINHPSSYPYSNGFLLNLHEKQLLGIARSGENQEHLKFELIDPAFQDLFEQPSHETRIISCQTKAQTTSTTSCNRFRNQREIPLFEKPLLNGPLRDLRLVPQNQIFERDPSEDLQNSFIFIQTAGQSKPAWTFETELELHESCESP